MGMRKPIDSIGSPLSTPPHPTATILLWGIRLLLSAPLLLFKTNFLKKICIGVSPINNVGDGFRQTAKGLSHTYRCIHSPQNSPSAQAALLFKCLNTLPQFLHEDHF